MLAVYLSVYQHCDHLTRRRRSWSAVYLNVCQHYDHLTRRRRSWSLCWPFTCVSVNIVITSRGEEGAGRCAGRLAVSLSNTVITSRGEEGAGRCAGRLAVCLSTLWSSHEGKKELFAVLAVYLSVCQHCDHLTRGRRIWSLCWPSTCVSVNIVITSRGEEGAGRCAGRLPVCLSNTVITSRGEEGAGRCASRLPVCLSTLWSPHEGKKELVAVLAIYLCVCLTLWSPNEGKKELVAVLAVYLCVCLTLWSPNEGKKELVAVLAVYLSVCQHCDHLTRGRRNWSLCWPSTWVSVNIVITSRGEKGAGRCAGRLPECLSTLWSPHEGKK